MQPVSGRAELSPRLPAAQHCVDLVVNTYERTYQTVLAQGFFPSIEEQNRRAFTQRIALINNVDDRRDAEARAQRLIRCGDLDAYYFVADYLDAALKITGLSKQDLGRIPHYTDCSLVAVTLPGSPYLLYWDAEVSLREAINWIDESIELLENDKRILVVNPCWPAPTLDRETWSFAGNFSVGYGFSDQLYLIRREDFARPIYASRCLASLRNPFAHVAAIFEQRVDAYMRTNRRLRATHTAAAYEHPEKDGSAYAALDWKERGRFLRNRALIALLKRLPLRHPCLKV